jgi:DNA repair protein SbcD/Mre11
VKVLHTSDWHVGKLIRGRSRVDEHRAVLDEIVALVGDQSIDLVLVGGDLYEHAAPTPESDEVVYSTLLALAETGAAVVVITGNHDNARRLAAIAPLLATAGVQLLAQPRSPADGGVRTIETAGGECARVALLPFVSQRGVVGADDLMAPGADQRSGRYADRVRSILDVLTRDMSTDTVNLVLAHLTVADFQPSSLRDLAAQLGGGERVAHILGDYVVPPFVFPADRPLSYVALGHLHRPHGWSDPFPIRYCGSPLTLDFGEAAGTKSVTVVDARPGHPASARDVELHSGRRLTTLRGTLEELEAARGTTGDDWLRVVVRGPVPAGVSDTVREWFADVVDVQIERDDDDDRAHLPEAGRSGRSPGELFADYLAERGIADERVPALFAELLEEALASDPA